METLRVPLAGGELQAYAWGDRATPGRGVPFLLVHGLASNALMWNGVGEALADLGHHAVAIDLRGHGRSWKPDDGYDFDTIATDVESVIEFLGFSRPVIAGQSWGGNVVLEVAARANDRVRGAVLVDGGWISLKSRFDSWESCRDALSPPSLAGTPVATMEAWIRDRHADWPPTSIEGAMGCFEVRGDGTVASWLTKDRHLQILRHLFDHQPTALYPKVAAPVLLAPADDGSAFSADKPTAVTEAASLLARSRTHWFAAHHDLHAQFPNEFAELLHACVADGFFE